MQWSWSWWRKRSGPAFLVALTILVGATPVAAGAQDDDIDCFEFTFQEDAQAELDADPSDPYNLDPNDDGIACALLPSADDAEDGGSPEATPAFQDDESLDAEPTADNQTIEAAQGDNAGNNGGGNNGGGNNGGGNNGQGNGRRNRNQSDATATAGANANERPNRNRNRNRNNNDVVCDDFSTEEDAQAELDADDTLAATLDGNDDGFACSDGDDVDLPSEAELADADTGGTFACDDYTTQAEAQAAYDVDPDLLIDLDTNGDGLACSDGDDVNLDDADDTVVAVDTGGDVDCIDFETQEAAQAVYDATAGDPNNLDPSNDGFACSELPSADGTVRVSSIPNTGTGPALEPAPPWWLPLALTLGFAALAAFTSASSARHRR